MFSLSSEIARKGTFGVNGSSTIVVEQVEGSFDGKDFLEGNEVGYVCAGVEARESACQLRL